MFNNYPIFKRIFFRQFASKINIGLSLIFIPSFIAAIVYGIISADLTIFGWVAFGIQIVYITFLNLFFVGSSFNKDLELGVTNLEIRSGYRKGSIFFQRIFAQKLFIVPVEAILFFIWIGFGFLSGVPFIKMSTTELMLGMLVIFIYEILISNFLLLFASFKNAIATTFFGVIIGILFAVMPLFSILDSYVNSSVVMNERNFSKYNMQKFPVLDSFDKIRSKYKDNKDNIIDNQISVKLPTNSNEAKNKTTDFYDAFGVYDSFFLKQVRGETEYKTVRNYKQNYDRDNERDIYDISETASFISKAYVNDLIYNGLAAELVENKLPLFSDQEYSFLNFIENEDEKNSYNDLVKNNNVLKFISEINSIDKEFSIGKTADYSDSFFTLDAKRNKRFSGELGFDNFINYLKNKKSNNPEMIEIINLINETVKFSYVDSYTTNGPRTSVFDIGGSISDDLSLAAKNTNLWLTTDANKEEMEWLNISSDGARVFFKVYFDVLREYIQNDTPEYNIGNINNDESMIDAETYLSEMKKKLYINPGLMLTSLFYNFGSNKIFQNSQNDFFEPFVNYVYDFDDSVIDERRFDYYLNLITNPNGSNLDDVIVWDLKDPNLTIDGNFLQNLRKLLVNENSKFEVNNLGFNYIELINEFSGRTLGGFQAYSKDNKFFGEKRFSILFENGDGIEGRPSPEQQVMIKDNIKNAYESGDGKLLKNETPTKADLYKFGKNDGLLYYYGSTFIVWIPVAILIIGSALLLEISWLIFNRRIIR